MKYENRSRTSIPGNNNNQRFMQIEQESNQMKEAVFDAGMERQISAAARRLGEDIQHVVFAAKQGNRAKRKMGGSDDDETDDDETDEWKDHLLQILGGVDNGGGGNGAKGESTQATTTPSIKSSAATVTKNESRRFTQSNQKRSDIDTLLAYSDCDKFVLRCLENELPPNLIHCLRLLRVLELQMAHSFALSTVMNSENSDDNQTREVVPLSTNATKKVEKLLCKLCCEQSVGEQLRPHLFGLLALSGATYPLNAVHVAQTASNVIIAVAKDCLNHNLSFFLHDRQMVVHMTDDVKELCGMTNSSSSNVASYFMLGPEAERHGLWYFALRAVVQLVKESCSKNFYGLLKDFYSAGGYHVLCYAILHSSMEHMKKMLELTILMVKCHTEEAAELGLEDVSLDSTSTTNSSDENLASNPSAFDIIENLMYSCIPLLNEYREQNHGAQLIIETGDPLRQLVQVSINFSLEALISHRDEVRNYDDGNSHLLPCEILLSTMQLYSDHPLNYTIIEEKYNILSQFILAYTTFENTDVKKLILRTLEYVCTGITDADSSKPLYVASEMFFALSKTIFRFSAEKEKTKEDHDVIESLKVDALTLCNSIEKLLQVEESLSEILIDCGILGDLLDEFLALIMTLPSGMNRQYESNEKAEDGNDFEATDEIYCALCTLLDLVVKSSFTVSANASPRADGRNSPAKSNIIERRRDDLNLILSTGIIELGNKASNAALSVFESKLSYGDDSALQNDMACILEIFNQLPKSHSKADDEDGVSYTSIEVKNGNELFNHGTCCMFVARNVLLMLRRVLTESKSSQDTFRLKGGYEALIRLLSSMKEINSSDDSIEMIVLKEIFDLFDASMMPTEREGKRLQVEGSSTFKSPAISNRIYVRQTCIYERFASALNDLGLFRSFTSARSVLLLLFRIFGPILFQESDNNGNTKLQIPVNLDFLRNPDAIRLILASILMLPAQEPFLSFGKECLGILLELCSHERAGTTLGQIADTGLCTILTSREDFVSIYSNAEHPFYTQFVTILRRISSFKMSFNDFVATIRGIAGPIVQSNHQSNIVLPVISLATTQHDDKSSSDSNNDKQENEFCLRLQTLVSIAEKGDRVPRCVLGGNLNPENYTSTVIYESARFIEVRKVDASADYTSSMIHSTTNSTGSNEKLWSPSHTSGFSFSLWLRLKDLNDISSGNIFVFDISSSSRIGAKADFITIWYDFISQGFNVMTSNSMKPICFPASPLSTRVWHHILITFQPPKLSSVLSRKTVLGLCVDGRPLEVDLKIDSVPLQPTSRIYIGVPNSTIVGGSIIEDNLPEWEAGSILLLSTILGPRDAMSIFAAGPDFHGQFWGDRPQRLSLAATATSIFSMLAECGERCSVAASLKRRNITELESVSNVMKDHFVDVDKSNEHSLMLSAIGLFCQLTPEYIVCALHPSSVSRDTRNQEWSYFSKEDSQHLVNVAKVNLSENVSSDAVVHGAGSIISPNCFADNVQWIGGPNILLPIVNAVKSSSTLALALRLVRESSHRHAPNLEMLQSGGGYRILAFLLHQKRIMDEVILEHCFSFAIHGFVPNLSLAEPIRVSNEWVLVDPDAMKYLIMNHQVWNLQNTGPKFCAHLVSLLNGLVQPNAVHTMFNSRRLHLLGIVKWIIHLMIEISELYTFGSIGEKVSKSKHELDQKQSQEVLGVVMSAFKNGWTNVNTLSITSTAVGGDPGISLLLSCKSFLRCILAKMLTPEDLNDIAGALIYSLSIDVMYEDVTSELGVETGDLKEDRKLRVGAVTRIYLTRLLEELVVDGINEITSNSVHANFMNGYNNENNLAQLSSLTSTEKKTFMNRMRSQAGTDDIQKQKEMNAQVFLTAFSDVLTPEWFACVLQGCRDEASASAVFRLLIIMLQTSQTYFNTFQGAGGFAPLVLSIPKYSTSPSIMLSILSQLLHAPILHLPTFGSLDAEQLCSVFEAESDVKELLNFSYGGPSSSADPVCGIFALLVECLGRNIQLGAVDNNIGLIARQTNEAVLHLLTNRYTFSIPFRKFCNSRQFLEPLSQALCLVHSEKIIGMESEALASHSSDNHSYSEFSNHSGGDRLVGEDAFVDWPSQNFDDSYTLDESGETKKPRKGNLRSINMDESATRRFVGGGGDSTGVGLVKLIRHIITHATTSASYAVSQVDAIFKYFPPRAPSQEVEAFHLVLIEQCKGVILSALDQNTNTSLQLLSNCNGINSVLLDRLCQGFFSSESILEATSLALTTLQCFSNKRSNAFKLLSEEDPTELIRSDAAHVARITTLVALQRSKPVTPWDLGDELLQHKLLELIGLHLANFYFNNPASLKLPESERAKKIWKSSSLNRFSLSHSKHYPDLSPTDQFDRAYTTCLMSELQPILLHANKELRENAAQVVVKLLRTRIDIMSDILKQKIQSLGTTMKQIDLFNEGGFGALQHHNTDGDNVDEALESLRLQTFFDWVDINQTEIDEVFGEIKKVAVESIPSIFRDEILFPNEAIRNIQRIMRTKSAPNDVSNAAMAETVNQSNLTQKSQENTSGNQALWKRQGFDDLSSGAMQWKLLLRQLKGSCSLWEGRSKPTEGLRSYYPAHLFTEVEAEPQHWKLDVSEGYERQRRKLLPNYEFDTLYNISNGKLDSGTEIIDSRTKELSDLDVYQPSPFDLDPDDVEATAEILAKMNLSKPKVYVEDDDEDDEDDYSNIDVDGDIDALKPQYIESERSMVPINKKDSSEEEVLGQHNEMDGIDQKPQDLQNKHEPEQIKEIQQNNYDLITGLLHAGDVPEKTYNVKRCTGLEVCPALFIICHNAIYVIDGFEQTDEDGLKGNINRVEKSTSTFHVSLRPKEFTPNDNDTNESQLYGEADKKVGTSHQRKKREDKPISSAEGLYQHRCKRISFRDIYIFYRRRYQLKQLALEIYDVYNNGTFVAFGNRYQSEEVLQSLLNASLPNSILKSIPGNASNFDKFMKGLRSRITSMWTQGKMSNFDFLMHVNSFAGRSYNDLTQYPVFPWVLADYESQDIDLSNPKIYRDLSKPMGALGKHRADQFKERYESLEHHFMKKDNDPPPFHYGTHYSCAAYVVNYLVRMEPFSRLALSLQGGKFDLPDRLFSDIAASWKSASHDNLQDVRELIPEFFYQPEFLENTNSFDFGTKQNGGTVHHVVLPPWARGDPRRFIRINRQVSSPQYLL